MQMSVDDIKNLLEEKARQYNKADFIEEDPISIPHAFSDKEDIEISGFFSATIAWGQRPVIVRNAKELMRWMDFKPFEFIKYARDSDLGIFKSFKHRTFNGEDCIYFIKALQNIYCNYSGLEQIFSNSMQANNNDIGIAIHEFRKLFFTVSPPGRTSKHVADPLGGSAAKRINMYLRWMVRTEGEVDFGIWKQIPTSALCCPLDVHSGNVARGLGILNRRANDWKAVTELTSYLKALDPEDPVKYDFALFGLGIYDNLGK